MSFLTSTNKNKLIGTENLVDSNQVTIESLCGCRFENPICPGGVLQSNGKCCGPSSTCYTPCLHHCELFVVTKLGKISSPISSYTMRESSDPFYFYRMIFTLLI